MPTLPLFNPEGDLTEVERVLEWIVDEVSGDDTVEVVTDQMVERLIAKRKQVAVFLYDKDDRQVHGFALAPTFGRNSQ